MTNLIIRCAISAAVLAAALAITAEDTIRALVGRKHPEGGC